MIVVFRQDAQTGDWTGSFNGMTIVVKHVIDIPRATLPGTFGFLEQICDLRVFWVIEIDGVLSRRRPSGEIATYKTASEAREAVEQAVTKLVNGLIAEGKAKAQQRSYSGVRAQI